MMDSRQTTQLQQMMKEQSGQAVVFAIASGKGGVGKTNIAANLAICLAASKKKVALFDADMGLGNLDVLMNISSRYNISDFLSGQKSFDQIIVAGPAGVEIICGGSGFEGLANLNEFQRARLVRELENLQNNYDAIVIDTGAGIGAATTGFCMAAEQVLVVTTPEPTAITDAYAFIKVLSGREYSGRINLVVNMAGSIDEGKRVYRQISDVARRFLDIVVYEGGILCRDERVVSAVRNRRPVVLAYPRSQIASSIVAMTARLARGTAAKACHEGFFQKVVNWFF